jgi:hypothetical protein
MQFGKIHKFNKTLSTNTCHSIFQKEERKFLNLNMNGLAMHEKREYLDANRKSVVHSLGAKFRHGYKTNKSFEIHGRKIVRSDFY